jgi:Amt family ammonium transporter
VGLALSQKAKKTEEEKKMSWSLDTTKWFKMGIIITCCLVLAISLANPLFASDPAGTATGTIKDVPAKEVGNPTLQEVAETAGHNRISINFVWLLICGFLVMFMQAGFALAETGFCRAKNATHTMAMNLMVYGIGMLGYWICGFAFQMGGVGPLAVVGNATAPLAGEFTITLFGKTLGLFGYTGFFLSGVAYDASIFALFLFQMVFMDTAATIPTGAMAERWKWMSFIIFSFAIGMLIYPIYGNWVWGGGWLATLGSNFGLGHGHVDFAGSSVVHMTGGVAALVGAKVLGARIGKFTKKGEPVAMPGHNIPMALLGCFILAFGWFGFNAGSTLAGTDLRIAVVAVNTMLASAAGAVSAMFYAWKKYGKPDPALSANGMLAGMVAITAPCAFVNSLGAVFIGVVSGLILVWGVNFVERVLKIDDPVGAITVHGMNGAWGVLSLGLFADGTYGDGFNGVAGPVRGLFYGDPAQFAAQSIGVIANIIWVAATAFLVLKIVGVLVGNRVPAEVEIQGLDMPEMGVPAYPDYVITGSSHLAGTAYASERAPSLRPVSEGAE